MTREVRALIVTAWAANTIAGAILGATCPHITAWGHAEAIMMTGAAEGAVVIHAARILERRG
jgi:hypothetical protein